MFSTPLSNVREEPGQDSRLPSTILEDLDWEMQHLYEILGRLGNYPTSMAEKIDQSLNRYLRNVAQAVDNFSKNYSLREPCQFSGIDPIHSLAEHHSSCSSTPSSGVVHSDNSPICLTAAEATYCLSLPQTISDEVPLPDLSPLWDTSNTSIFGFDADEQSITNLFSAAFDTEMNQSSMDDCPPMPVSNENVLHEITFPASAPAFEGSTVGHTPTAPLEPGAHQPMCLDPMQMDSLDSVESMSTTLCEQLGNQASIVSKFYNAIGSSKALTQLRDSIGYFIPAGVMDVTFDFSNVEKLVHMMDHLDNIQSTTAFIRKMVLLRLVRHREAITHELEKSIEDTRNKGMPLGKRPDALVLDEMMHRAYPKITRASDTEQYLTKRKSLTNQMKAARNWCSLVELFGLGILLLVPTGGERDLQNQKFENLRIPSFEILARHLETKGSGYITEAARLLTPFVQAVYDGNPQLHRLRTEVLHHIQIPNTDPHEFVRICRLLVNDESQRLVVQ